MGKTHKDLDIWQRGIDLVVQVYQATKTFPREEEYGLKPQMRRAAVSYPSNMRKEPPDLPRGSIFTSSTSP